MAVRAHGFTSVGHCKVQDPLITQLAPRPRLSNYPIIYQHQIEGDRGKETDRGPRPERRLARVERTDLAQRAGVRQQQRRGLFTGSA